MPLRTTPTKRVRNRIGQALLEIGTSETAWAQAHGFDQGHINKVKNGRIEPTGYMMLRIAKCLGKDVGKVFWLGEEPS